jgi:hypothetical protein
MKTKINVSYIIICLLTVGYIPITILFRESQRNIKEYVLDIETTNNVKILSLQQQYANAFIYQMKADCDKVDFSWNIKDIKGNQIPVVELLGGRDKLMFRIPSNSCGLCYDSSLKMISKMAKIVGDENFFVLIPINRGREFMTFFKENNCENVNFYFTDENLKISSMDDNSIPFFFLVSADLSSRHYFYLQKEQMDLNLSYLNFIQETYFKTIALIN